MGLSYLALLVDRSLLPEPRVVQMAWAMPIEFAVIHCSGFLALPWVALWKDRRKRLAYVSALAGGYTVALAVIALVVHAWWPLAIFWGLMLNRMLAVILGDLPDDTTFTSWTMSWAGATTLFVLSVCAGILGGPTLVGQALLMGFLYFTLVGLSELTGWAWVHRWMRNARARAARRA